LLKLFLNDNFKIFGDMRGFEEFRDKTILSIIPWLVVDAEEQEVEQREQEAIEHITHLENEIYALKRKEQK
jgi:hypothetical protein